jgi:hypothetical protein
MRKLITLCLIITLICGCTFHTQNISTYKESPKFIRSFLDSLHQGKFEIAEKEQDWTSGCIVNDSIPSMQFISATLTSDKYIMHYWAGGIVGPHKSVLVIQFDSAKVTSYSFDGGKPTRVAGA